MPTFDYRNAKCILERKNIRKEKNIKSRNEVMN